MKMNLGGKLLAYGLGMGLVAIGGVAFAQGIGKMSPSMHPAQPAVKQPAVKQPAAKQPATGKSTAANQAAVRQRVIAWFTKYDEIRHDAQMTAEEKASSHALMSAALTGNDGDAKAGKQLLSKMVSRYTKATAQLQSLQSIPETAALQKGYLQYFKTGRDFFQHYLQALSAGRTDKEVATLQKGRHDLGSLDLSNKALDKKLRKQYNIAAYRWD